MSYKILIVAGAFYPINSPRSLRATELAKELALQGHSVTVYTDRNNEVHTDFEKEHNIVIKDLGKNRFVSIQLSGSRLSVIFKRLSARVLNLLFEYPKIEYFFKVKKALKLESGYDLLISIAVPYPIHWGVAFVYKKKCALAKKWVADCGDPYYLDIADTFKKLFYFKFIEKWAFRKADFISIPIEAGKGGYFPEFHKKIVIISQGVKFDKSAIKTNYVVNEIPTFAFAGSLIKNYRDPTEFLKELTNINLPFKFIVYTNKSILLEPFKNSLKDKIEIRNYIPRTELLNELKKYDFVINFENAEKVQVPSKLIDYVLIERPILSVSNSFDEKDNFIQFLNGNYSSQFVVQDIDKFKIENVAKKFIELIEINNTK